MRSYEAARSLFSFLAMCAWGVIVVGGLVAVIGMEAVSSYGSPGALKLFAAATPGIAVALGGFLFLALVENGRAAVDTAELTQQMLKVARDQLAVSQQTLNQGKVLEAGFAALRGASASESSSQSAASSSQTNGYGAASTSSENASRTPEVPAIDQKPNFAFTYLGHQVTALNGMYLVDQLTFASAAEARRHIDQLPSGVLAAPRR